MTSIETWTVDIQIFEGDDNTAARASLFSGSGANRRCTLVGTGRARRNPHDPAVPEIGAEIATARALRDLADRLLGAASDDIADIEHTEVHLTH
jgi:hypothetical protein